MVKVSRVKDVKNFDDQVSWDHNFGFGSVLFGGKTSNFLPATFCFNLSTNLYIRRLKISYHFSASSFEKVLNDFSGTKDFFLSKYYDRDIKTNPELNLYAHDFVLGYEMRLHKRFTITPSIGFNRSAFILMTQNEKDKKYRFDGVSASIPIRWYFVMEGEGTGLFIGLTPSISVSNFGNKFNGFDNYYYNTYINVGVKFPFTGKGLATFLPAVLEKL